MGGAYRQPMSDQRSKKTNGGGALESIVSKQTKGPDFQYRTKLELRQKNTIFESVVYGCLALKS